MSVFENGIFRSHQSQWQCLSQVKPSLGMASKTGVSAGRAAMTAQALVYSESHVSGERQCVFAPWQQRR